MPAVYKIAQGKSGVSYTKGMCVKGGKERQHNHTENPLPIQTIQKELLEMQDEMYKNREDCPAKIKVDINNL